MKSLTVIAALLVLTVIGVAVADESDFVFPYSDGLYATVTLFKRIPKPDVDGEQIVKLFVPGFRGEMKVRALWQKDNYGHIRVAPLAVVLPGLAGRSNASLSRVWQSLLYEAGCHVMTADSAFSNEFNEASGQGVAGNVEAEAGAVARVIGAFLETPEAQGRIADVRLLGTSYGGNLALYLARMSREGRLPFQLGAVVVLSPPVSMRTSARLLDSYYVQDFGSYAYKRARLAKLRDEPLVSPGAPVPFEPRLMRASIGYVFHNMLKPVVQFNDRRYCLGQIDQHKQIGDKLGNAQGWTYTEFFEEMSYPYWRQQGASQNLDEFWALGNLEDLLPGASDNVFVYLSKDDPLDSPDEVSSLELQFKPPLLTVLPCGGHLGFAPTAWMKQTVINRLGAQNACTFVQPCVRAAVNCAP